VTTGSSVLLLQITLFFTFPDNLNEADVTQSSCGAEESSSSVITGSESNHSVVHPEALSLVTHV